MLILVVLIVLYFSAIPFSQKISSFVEAQWANPRLFRWFCYGLQVVAFSLFVYLWKGYSAEFVFSLIFGLIAVVFGAIFILFGYAASKF